MQLPSIVINEGTRRYFLKYEQILFVKADGPYSSLTLKDNRRISVSKTLKSLEASLPEEIFHRVHHSYLVNMGHVYYFQNRNENYLMMHSGEKIPVSKRRRPEFLSLYSSKKL